MELEYGDFVHGTGVAATAEIRLLVRFRQPQRSFSLPRDLLLRDVRWVILVTTEVSDQFFGLRIGDEDIARRRQEILVSIVVGKSASASINNVPLRLTLRRYSCFRFCISSSDQS